MPKIVSVSLGSSSRNHSTKITVEGEVYELERVGTDGSLSRAQALIRELDGKVSAIGLGGIDLYLFAGNKRYTIRDALKLKRCAHKTPVVDGSGIKHSLEKKAIDYVARETPFLKAKTKVLLVSAVDRWGMAQAFVEHGCDVIFGDFLFGLGVPIPLRSLKAVAIAAQILLPILTRLPFTLLYPTGKKQEKTVSRYPRYFAWAEVIAGDFLYIRRYLPEVENKMLITNTVTSQDLEFLRKRGVRTLVTTTPEMEGRSFGTNVLDALCVAILKKAPEEMTAADYEEVFNRLSLRFRIEHLVPLHE